MERIERSLTTAVQSAGFDSTFFKYALQMTVDIQKSDGKTGSQIRYAVYRHWARELKRMDVGMDTMGNPQYEFPKEATEYLRKLTGGPAKREKRQVKVVVPMEVLCRALAVPPRT
ncbi:uncharacterized protein LOC132760018 [Ruditapes philippinarum]|uniref:uncharacterized protein LOC132744762 n=1 Tax=Ruditapes philippinarum TaxID=129788 RepID=UPI00295B6DC4|nr:uncharacterized protein LOC132744762 [Ruditapes philippinarum]XP_060607890.1 uncharacterized protein LOC132760018 [Ruditapes philippinarum]